MQNNKDPFGKACLAYLKGIRGLEITVKSDHTENDILPVDYLFRTYDQMPLLEQTALNLCKGSVLDIGAGAGCHSKWLLEQNTKVIALDQSKGAVEALLAQNITAQQTDFFQLNEDIKFDTLLALMNGTGIGGTANRFPEFLNKCKSLLTKKGQLIIDSTDLKLLFNRDNITKPEVSGKYYGQVKYQMVFDGEESDWFDWVYFPFEKLKEICVQNDMKCEYIFEGSNFDYLAKITSLD